MNRRGVRAALALVLAAAGHTGVCQTLVYVDAGNAACPAVPAVVAAKAVPVGTPVPGKLRVPCGFDQGSYTVSLDSTDPQATIAPRSFLVNFGRLVGQGAFKVTFASVGRHSLSATITSNMGSPALRGHFAGSGIEFNVLPR